MRVRILALVGLCLLLAPGAGAGAPSPRLTVFAASSLTNVMPVIAPSQLYSFGGSDALAAQITQGAPADVFASANVALPMQLHAAGLVASPVVFTRNALVLVVPESNPANIRSVFDLARSGVRIDDALPTVPVGLYTQQVVQRLGLSAQVNANVVSQEPDVRTVLSKVALGQADAGFVYATDARTVQGKVRVIRVPAWAQPKVSYAVAVVTHSTHKAAARAYVARLLGKPAQAAFARFGFLPLPRET